MWRIENQNQKDIHSRCVCVCVYHVFRHLYQVMYRFLVLPSILHVICSMFPIANLPIYLPHFSSMFRLVFSPSSFSFLPFNHPPKSKNLNTCKSIALAYANSLNSALLEDVAHWLRCNKQKKWFLQLKHWKCTWIIPFWFFLPDPRATLENLCNAISCRLNYSYSLEFRVPHINIELKKWIRQHNSEAEVCNRRKENRSPLQVHKEFMRNKS